MCYEGEGGVDKPGTTEMCVRQISACSNPPSTVISEKIAVLAAGVGTFRWNILAWTQSEWHFLCKESPAVQPATEMLLFCAKQNTFLLFRVENSPQKCIYFNITTHKNYIQNFILLLYKYTTSPLNHNSMTLLSYSSNEEKSSEQ